MAYRRLLARFAVALLLAAPAAAVDTAPNATPPAQNWKPALVGLQTWAVTPQAAVFGAGPKTLWDSLKHVDFKSPSGSVIAAPLVAQLEALPPHERDETAAAMRRAGGKSGNPTPLSDAEAAIMVKRLNAARDAAAPNVNKVVSFALDLQLILKKKEPLHDRRLHEARIRQMTKLLEHLAGLSIYSEHVLIEAGGVAERVQYLSAEYDKRWP